MGKRSIGIDQSIRCSGICLFDGDDQLIKMETVGSEINHDDPLDVFTRSKLIASFIKDRIVEYGVEQVFIEGLATGNVKGNSSRDLAILQGIIISTIMDLGLTDVNILNIKSVKKFATGSGNAGKVEMYESLPDDVKQIAGEFLKTKGRYDVTDAYFIGKMGLSLKSEQVSK